MNGKYTPPPDLSTYAKKSEITNFITASRATGTSGCGVTKNSNSFTFVDIDRFAAGPLRIYVFTMNVTSDIASWTNVFSVTDSYAKGVGVISKRTSTESAVLYKDGVIYTGSPVTTGYWQGILVCYNA